MKCMNRVVSTSFVIVVLLILAAIPIRAIASENITTEQSGRFKILGPFTHRNLALYLVKGKDVIRKTKFVTLEQALKDEKVTVGETGNVRNLVISSKYDEEYVFIQAGDIVKGGKQDRTLSTDLIVPPSAKKIPLQSFCVESGRWRARGTENVDKFSMSSNQVASRDLRVASRYSRSQQEVWDNAAKLQEKLSGNVGKSVRSPVSSSSLELTLGNKDVRKHAEKYVNALRDIIKGRKHIIGFVFAINGQLNTAEVYGSEDLFRQLWSKMLRTAAVEAFAELKKDKHFKAPSTKAAAAFLEYPRETKVQRNRVNDWLTAITHEGKDKVIFESLFSEEHALVHVTTVRMDEKDRRKLRSRQPQQSLEQNQVPNLQQERQRRR
ncbi:MAG: ARPP-1 family domain-containing protein [Planctomycetota bacterium]